MLFKLADFLSANKGFNRTFMELKYDIAKKDDLQNLSFNRTFMELKY